MFSGGIEIEHWIEMGLMSWIYSKVLVKAPERRQLKSFVKFRYIRHNIYYVN